MSGITEHYSTFETTPPGTVIKQESRYTFSTRWLRHDQYEARMAELEQDWLRENPKPDYKELWVGAPKQLENGYRNQEYKIGAYPQFTDEYQAWWNERYGAIENWKKATNFTERAAEFEVRSKAHEQALRQKKLEWSNQLDAEFPFNDGPEFVEVVSNAYNRNYRDDPDCFDGDRWITVKPPSDWRIK